MSVLPQATSRRELREREAAARARPARRARSARHTRHTPHTRHAIGRRLLSLSAMLFVGALAVGLSIPVNAFGTSSPAQAAAASAPVSTTPAGGAGGSDGQTATVPRDETIAAAARDSYQVQSRAENLAMQYAQTGTYTNAGGRGSLRWPFKGHPAISSPYGPRASICEGSARTDDFHHGTDFLVGDGAPIFAIASGVVVDHTEDVTDLGNTVTIRHRVGRDVVTSTYGHMQAGSSPLVVGQTVHVGDFIGLAGATGVATGPHLHLGITVNGVETDPVPWMQGHVK